MTEQRTDRPIPAPAPADQAATMPGATLPRRALPRAVLWDLDGTLMDSEPLWFVQERELVAEYGGEWTHDDALSLVGLALPDSAEIIRARTPVSLRVRDIVERMQAGVVEGMRAAVPWRPGARELLLELAAARVPQALVTMSWRPVLEVVLGSLPAGVFTAVVTGDMVARGKPDPEPYRRALDELGVADPEVAACVAIEDSTTGAASAVGAGIPTIVTPCVKPVPPAPGLVLLPSLAEMRAADLLPAAAPARHGVTGTSASASAELER